MNIKIVNVVIDIVVRVFLLVGNVVAWTNLDVRFIGDLLKIINRRITDWASSTLFNTGLKIHEADDYSSETTENTKDIVIPNEH